VSPLGRWNILARRGAENPRRGGRGPGSLRTQRRRGFGGGGDLGSRAIKERLVCVFVNNGLLRKKRAEQVCGLFFERFGHSFYYVDASEQFLGALKGLEDPEIKRKRIGHTFIEVLKTKHASLVRSNFWRREHLSRRDRVGLSFGPSATIKSHHNVGGLPIDMKFKIDRAAARAFQR